MPTESRIEAAVMRRVRRARIVRPFVSIAPALMLFAAAAYGLKREVWVARVIENMPHDALAAIRFFVQAFITTELVVQTLFILLALALVWAVRELRAALPLALAARAA